jgi:RNA polymerase sigma-70 factor (ECF subfamily)
VQLIEDHYQRIYAFLRRLCGNDADAADLTQKTFGRVWQSLSTFSGQSSFSSWTHGIAYHVYVDWRRANHRTEARSDEWWAGRVCPGLKPDELVARGDLAERLFFSVDQLDADMRDTIHLHYYQQLTLQETAEAMGVASSTVKYRLRQALQELGNKIEPQPASTLGRSIPGRL